MVVIMGQLFVSTYVVIDFVINQDYIAANFCVQKDDQQGCNGKCHLTKTLKETAPSDTNSSQQNTPRLTLKFDFLVSIFETKKDSNNLISETNKIPFIWFSFKTITRYYDVLTPPPDLA